MIICEYVCDWLYVSAVEERSSGSSPLGRLTMEDEGRRKALKLDLGNLTEKNMGQLKKLNTATFPVKYKDQFYLDLVKYFDYCRLGFYADVLVGSICCRLEDREDGGKALYIMTLSILEPYRKRNLASQLVQWILDRAQSKECQEKDVREIYLHVPNIQQNCIAVLQEVWFQGDGEDL